MRIWIAKVGDSFYLMMRDFNGYISVIGRYLIKEIAQAMGI
jgi:hypothetical protein